MARVVRRYLSPIFQICILISIYLFLKLWSLRLGVYLYVLSHYLQNNLV